MSHASVQQHCNLFRNTACGFKETNMEPMFPALCFRVQPCTCTEHALCSLKSACGWEEKVKEVVRGVVGCLGKDARLQVWAGDWCRWLYACEHEGETHRCLQEDEGKKRGWIERYALGSGAESGWFIFLRCDSPFVNHAVYISKELLRDTGKEIERGGERERRKEGEKTR